MSYTPKYLIENKNNYPDEPALSVKINDVWSTLTWSEYYEYVLKSYDGLVLKSAKEETVEKIKSEKQKSSKLEIDDDMLESELKDYLFNDVQVRKYLNEELAHASVSKIQIERLARSAVVTINTARPGIVIGKKGEDVEKIRAELTKMMDIPVRINIEEIRKPELDANLVAGGVAQQLEKRVMFRRAMKRAVQNAMRAGALGIKINVAGRLNGAEIARGEWYREGRVPLHTLRADVDYGVAEANTTYGIIGIKVWIYKGEVFGLGEENTEATQDKAAK